MWLSDRARKLSDADVASGLLPRAGEPAGGRHPLAYAETLYVCPGLSRAVAVEQGRGPSPVPREFAVDSLRVGGKLANSLAAWAANFPFRSSISPASHGLAPFLRNFLQGSPIQTFFLAESGFCRIAFLGGV